MVKQIFKLIDRISLLRNQLKVMVKDLESTEQLSETTKNRLEYTFKEQEYLDKGLKFNKECEDRLSDGRKTFIKTNEIKEVPVSKTVISDSSQLYYNVVEMSSEKFEYQSASMEVIPEKFCKVEMEAPILHISESYEMVEEEFVHNFPRKELKLVNVIYINAPADIKLLDNQQFEEIDSILDLRLKSGCCVQYLVDCNMKTDENEEWKKKIDPKCESEKLLNLDFSLGQDFDTQKTYGTEDKLEIIGHLYLEISMNLTNVDTVYLSPALYSWDVHNEPSNRLFSLWFVYDRGKFAFYV